MLPFAKSNDRSTSLRGNRPFPKTSAPTDAAFSQFPDLAVPGSLRQRQGATQSTRSDFNRNKGTALRSNQRLRGVLKQGDRFNFGLSSFIDEYNLRRLKPGQVIEINLKSNQFDGYLELRDASTRRTLLYGEDIDSFNSDARLVFTVQPKVRYQVRVSVSPDPILGSSNEGRYSLRSQIIPPVPGFNFFYGDGLVNAAAAVARSMQSSSPSGVIGQPALSGNPSNSPSWGINAIGATISQANGFDGQGVIVAVLDTGVDYQHSGLKQNLWRNPNEIPANGIDDDRNGFIDDVNGWDFVSQDNDPNDFDGHGTAVAGIIAASPTAQVPGVAPRAKIMPVRVLSDNEDSEDSDSIADGIRYAIRNGAKVINMSLSSSPGSSLFQSLPDNMAALQEARQAGVTVVMAAGNDREDFGAVRPVEPAYAALQGLGIAVGAVDRNLQVADFSNPAGDRPMSFVVAPGVDILSTDRLNGYRSDNTGTSFSAPFVSGTVALMLSANPALTPAQIAAILTQTATRQGLTLYP